MTWSRNSLIAVCFVNDQKKEDNLGWTVYGRELEKKLSFYIYESSNSGDWRKLNENVTVKILHLIRVFFCLIGKNFFYPPPPPQTEKNAPKRGELFSFFEIFTAEFSHFLVTKKNVFLSQKVTKLCSENFEK